jgi:antitoxin ParD1/3/4
MTVKSSVSLTDQQAAFARSLVEEGRYSSLSAVLQRGLEMLREAQETRQAEAEALRALLRERAKGPFISAEELDHRVEARIASHRASLG